MNDKPYHLVVTEHIVDLISNPGHEPHPDERSAWNCLGELGNAFGVYLDKYIADPEISDEQKMGLRRGGVLFHQMIINAQKGL